MDYRAIQDPVRLQLQDAERVLAGHARGKGRLISALRESTPVGKGKKIRAAFFFLLAGMHRLRGDELPRLAAAIEMLHLSSLVHDDIMDNSSRRRGEKTANQHFGNTLSVLWGDYLFINSLHLLDCKWRNPTMNMLLDVSRQMIEGQILEFENSFNYNIPSRTYFEIIRKKTASMFAGIAGLVEQMAGANAPAPRGLRDFGRHFGMIFQISDDLLDIFSSRAGKDRFQDLKEGKVTLPYILLLRHGALPLIKKFSAARPQLLLERCRELEIKKRSVMVIDRYVRKCDAFLAEFPPSAHRESMQRLLQFIRYRDY
jgi:octaprenyl-diphosphate synthase